jgi:hypothetical protein
MGAIKWSKDGGDRRLRLGMLKLWAVMGTVE